MLANKVRLQTKIGTAQIVIIVLAVFTALVHLGLFVRSGDVVMLLNSLGYLGLLMLYFVKFNFLPIKREWIRWAFMAYTFITILAYFISWGARSFESPMGVITKLIEVALIFMLWREK